MKKKEVIKLKFDLYSKPNLKIVIVTIADTEIYFKQIHNLIIIDRSLLSRFIFSSFQLEYRINFNFVTN